MSLCINYRCLQENAPDAVQCHACGSPLLIQNRFWAIQSLRPSTHAWITQIFEVVDSETGQHKILRLLNSDDPSLIESIMLMAIALQRVQVPYPTVGVPQVEPTCFFEWQAAGSSIKSFGIVLEKVEGTRLDHWLNKHGRLPQRQAVQWLIELAEIATAFHRHGFLHRDIKLDNIILRPNGKLALIDFDTVCQMDLAYVAGLDSQKVRISSRAAALTPGTPGYSSPEQNEGKAVPASDFFSIGRTIVHLLTGEHPIDLPRNPHTGGLIWRSKAKQIQPLFADFIDRLMSPNPIDRPHDAEKIIAYLHELPYRARRQAIWQSIPVRISVGVLAGVGIMTGVRFSIPIYRTHVANEYLVQANQLQSAGNQREARRLYEKALEYLPDDSAARSSLALSCALSGDTKCAEAEFNRAIQINSDNVIAHYNLANVYERQDRYPLAESHYLAAATTGSPLRSEAINNLARMEILQGHIVNALEIIRQELKHSQADPTRAALYKNLAWAMFEQRQFRSARDWLNQSLQLDPTRTDTYCLIAKVREKLGETPMNDWTTCLMLQSGDEQPEVQAWKAEVLQRIQIKS